MNKDVVVGKYSGIKGRSVAAEVIMIDLKMIKYIGEGRTIDLMMHWRSLVGRDPSSENMREKLVWNMVFKKC